MQTKNRTRIISSFLGLLSAASIAVADPIRYNQIPAEASGYFSFDVDALLSSHVAAEIGAPSDAGARMKKILGGQVQSITVFCLGRAGDEQNLVVLLHLALGPAARQALQTQLAKGKEAVVFNIGGQEVEYSPDSLEKIAQATAESMSKTTSPATNPSDAPTESHPSSEPKHMSFTLGMGQEGKFNDWTSGHSYVAFVGPDLLVATSDLSSISTALNVLSGAKPSLETQDPQHLKADHLPPGVMAVGAGLTAEFEPIGTDAAGNPKPITTQPVTVSDPGAGGFGLDLFGSFKGKARLARFDAGENDQSVFVDSSFDMVDSDSAQQLKNLILGVKALVSLSDVKNKQYVDPLDVRANAKSVALHWEWPSAKLVELFHNGKSTSNHARPVPNNSDTPVH